MPRSALTVVSITAFVAVAVGFAPPASADTPAHPNCLGVVTAQRAVAHHDIGEHASDQEEPRLGLGNVTSEVLGEDAHIGDFGSFLGAIDGDEATNCP